MRKCLIVDEMHPSLFDLLRSAGWDGIYQPEITREGILAALPGVEGLIVRSKVLVDRALLTGNAHLKFIARAGAGVDNVDTDFAAALGIPVIHAAEGNRDAVGEFTIGLLLGLLRHIPRAHAEVARYEWNREANRGVELGSLVVGIIGYGNMGQAFARRLLGFGCKILVYDKYKSGFSTPGIEEVTLQALQAEVDVLSLHIPLTSETRGMISLEFLRRCRKPVYLVNTARGEILYFSVMLEALNSGMLRGLAADVLENERLATLTPAQRADFEVLKNHPHVIFTPHIAGWTMESHEKINLALVAKISELEL